MTLRGSLSLVALAVLAWGCGKADSTGRGAGDNEMQMDPVVPGDGDAGDGDSGDGDGDSNPVIERLYVDDDSVTDTPDGLSWETAYPTIQEAIDDGSADEIWVAVGRYAPMAKNASVAVLRDGVTIYGGFVGTETSLVDRSDPNLAMSDAARTVLDGDFDRNGNPAVETLADHDNSFHVVEGASNVVLDGLTIKNGAAVDPMPTVPDDVCVDSEVMPATNLDPDLRSGGLAAPALSNLTVRNSRFVDNGSFRSGGAMNCSGSSNVVVEDSVFSGNATARNGAAVSARHCDISLTRVQFQNNTAAGRGGAINVDAGVGDCTDPGVPTARVVLNSSDFVGNQADQGGALSARASAIVEATDVEFVDNQSSGGGALFVADTEIELVNLMAENNDSVERADTSGGRGGFLELTGASTLEIDGALIEDSDADVKGGAIRLGGGDAWIRNTVFLNNTADRGAGIAIEGGAALRGGSLTFDTNVATQKGGALFANQSGGVTLTNVAFSRNETTITTGGHGGGALYFEDDSATVTNATFYRNVVARRGGAILSKNSTVAVHNVIYSENSAAVEGADVHSEGTAVVENRVCTTASIEEGPNGELFLNQSGGCIDGGDESAANDTTSGFLPIVGRSWETLTTAASGAVDQDTGASDEIDYGVHYFPDGP